MAIDRHKHNVGCNNQGGSNCELWLVGHAAQIISYTSVRFENNFFCLDPCDPHTVTYLFKTAFL